MTLFRGIADDVDLSEWLEKRIFPLEAKLTADDIYCGAMAAALEMIKSGTTSFLDMYFMMDSVAKACKETGIRGFLSAGIMDLGATPEEAEKKLKDCEQFISRWASDDLVTPSVGPHAIYTCSEDFLRRSVALAQKQGVLIHMHLSETQKEVEDCKKEHGIAPAEYLEELGLLCPQLVVAHAVWLAESEMDLLKSRGVGVAHCPISNLKLGSGIAKVYEMRKKGIRVGLGTDSAASNNNLDLFEEIKFAALLQKGTLLDPKAISAQEALDMATIDGAKCLGAEDRIGSIEEGKLADMILIDLANPRFTPMHNVLSNIVYSANGSDVITTIINGKVVMEDRRLLTLDEGEALKKVQTASDDLLKRK